MNDDKIGPRREYVLHQWPIAGWRIVQWGLMGPTLTDLPEAAIEDGWFTIARAEEAPDPVGHDRFGSIHEAMAAVVAHTYQPGDGIDAQGQAFTFLRAIGAHVFDRESGEWTLVPPPGRP